MIEKIISGIVLDKFEFEDEHIVKILSEGGSILSLKSKGLYNNDSKNRMSLNLFNLVEVEYFTSKNSSGFTGRLKTAKVIKEFISYDPLSLYLVQQSRNILLDLNNNSILTFKSLTKIIDSIENNNYSFQKFLALIIIVLRQNNYKPIIDKCVKCGSNKDIIGFSIYEGGLLCKLHKEFYNYKLPSTTLRKIIEINSLKDPSICSDLQLTPEEESQIKSMYDLFLNNQMGVSVSLKKI